jgi:hypothetical protein
MSVPGAVSENEPRDESYPYRRWSITNRTMRRYRTSVWWAHQRRADGAELPVAVIERGVFFTAMGVLYRRAFRFLEGAILILTGSVPVAVAGDAPNLVVAALGAMAAVGTGIRQVFRPHESWVDYTRNRVQVEGQVVAFLYALPPYEESDAAPAKLGRY